ncbi:transglycosylase SLT domain-containing protein [Halomonas sp. hl-4]|uniref:transglycosylase SLT domain-containing protein n=1 Tax=Halomonas sp. hl-4 TaxID=1761789 RepID=UPI000BB95E9B|nr:transglycosylase SLT domain-containing protein [Halomonas sp. hl-4]SNY96504.1 soluble lytic murein transglycosylase [Halomonas sp. hl-4]
MPRTARVLSIAFIACLPTISWAASDSALRDALEAARDKQWDRINMSAIEDHPLSGYVTYHRLRDQLPELPPETVNRYIDTHSDSPLSDWMRGQAIDQYGEAKQYSDVRAVSNGEPTGAARQCHYHTAHLDSAPQQTAEAGLRLWHTGQSQPNACDPLFKRLRANGTIDDEAIWERQMLAWQAGNSRLADYLSKQLSGAWQTAIDTYETIDSDPQKLREAPTCLGPECAATATFYQAAMQRLIHEDTSQALAVWRSLAERLSLLPSDQRLIEEELAYYALVHEVPNSMAWVDSVLPHLESERAFGLRVRRALQAQQWEGVRHWITQMPAEQQKDARWQYWLARASEQLGDQAAAESHFQQAASQRSFYGFAAAERLGQPLALNNERFYFDDASRERVAQQPAVQRTQALMRIGEDGLANSEWLHVVQQASTEEARALADFAAEQGWHARLVQTTIAAGLWDALEWRFPQAYHDEFIHWGRLSGVDPYLLMAITRRESAYNPNALSPAGARGLMQLMPGTASQVSRQIGLEDPGAYGVLDPELNIRLGSTYLRDKLQRYQGNRLAATAAYNAGPGRVDRWLGDYSIEAFDLFVERIPYRETRDYVQAVLSYRAIFESLANGSSDGVSLLRDGEKQVRYNRALVLRD